MEGEGVKGKDALFDLAGSEDFVVSGQVIGGSQVTSRGERKRKPESKSESGPRKLETGDLVNGD